MTATNLVVQFPVNAPRAQPRERVLRANAMKLIKARGGWAFPTTGVSETGIPDLVGTYRGRGLALELKTATGKLTPKQKYHLALAGRAGAVAVVCRSIRDVADVLDQIDKEIDDMTNTDRPSQRAQEQKSGGAS